MPDAVELSRGQPGWAAAAAAAVGANKALNCENVC